MDSKNKKKDLEFKIKQKVSTKILDIIEEGKLPKNLTQAQRQNVLEKLNLPNLEIS